MTLGTVLAPLSAKIILGLALALGASLTGNYLQQKHIWTEAGAATKQVELDKVNGRNAVLERAAAINSALQERAAPENAQVLEQLASIQSLIEKPRVEYRRAAAAKPLPPNCAPGQARMDAVNHALNPGAAP